MTKLFCKILSLAVMVSVAASETVDVTRLPAPASPQSQSQNTLNVRDMQEVVPSFDETPRGGGKLNLNFDPENRELPQDGLRRSIQEEISIDLIDIAPFREALEPKTGQQKLRLGLEECIQIALRQNTDIVISSFDPLAAESDIQAARGIFDPVLSASGTHTYADVSASQQNVAYGGISSVENYQTNLRSTVTGRISYGTEYSFNFDANKEATTFGNFIDEFDSSIGLTITQPLLRGFGKNFNTVRIRSAEKSRDISEAQLRLTVLNTVSEVIKAYWDLVGAIETLSVREESLANAERLYDINVTRRDIGTAADIEVLQAKAGVAARQGDVVSARARIADAEDYLKQILDMREDGIFSNARIHPLDRPNLNDTYLIDPDNFEASLKVSIERSLRNRPEMMIASLDIEMATLEEFRARREMLPQLDITASYSQAGRDRSRSTTIEKMLEADDNVYSYGVVASVPIGNRAARGAHERAQIQRRQSELRERQTEQQMTMNVRMAARNVLTNKVLVESNERARQLQEANVLAEERRLRLGTTTSYQVLQVMEDLTLAQTQEVQAQIAFENSLVDLQLTEGTLLQNLGIEFENLAETERTGYLTSITPRWK